MFKKLLLTTAIFSATTGVALASAPYFGVDLGVNNNTSKVANYRAFNAKLAAGYSAEVGQGAYLAGEAFVVPGTANINDNGLKSTYGFGASILPGVMLSDHTVGFGRLGVVRSRFNPSNVSSKTVNGCQLGLGLQTNLTQNWDLRGEYDYTNYQSITNLGTPRSDQFNLGLVYKFE